MHSLLHTAGEEMQIICVFFFCFLIVGLKVVRFKYIQSKEIVELAYKTTTKCQVAQKENMTSVFLMVAMS